MHHVGRVPIEVESVGVELADDAIIELERGQPLAKVITQPEHLERHEDRDMTTRNVGTRRVRRLVAVGSDGRRYYGKVASEWRMARDWPR